MKFIKNRVISCKYWFKNLWKLNKNQFEPPLRSNKILTLFECCFHTEGWADLRKTKHFTLTILNFQFRLMIY